MFNTTLKELGRVKVGTELVMHFTYEDLDITKLESSCGCGIVNHDKKNKDVIVTYTAGKIPEHLRLQGKSEYSTAKTVTVTANLPDGTENTIILQFRATVTTH